MSVTRSWSVIERVCIVGGGVIGSLFAGHLAQRRARSRCSPDGASMPTRSNREGLRVSGKSERQARGAARDRPGRALRRPTSRSSRPRRPGLERRCETLDGPFPDATMTTVLNGLGAEEIVREHGDVADRLRASRS